MLEECLLYLSLSNFLSNFLNAGLGANTVFAFLVTEDISANLSLFLRPICYVHGYVYYS